MPTKIAKSNFYWTVGEKALWNIRGNILSEHVIWIDHSISHFLVIYSQDQQKFRAKQPINKIQKIIENNDYDELAKILNDDTIASEYYIGFLERMCSSYAVFYKIIIERTSGNNKDEIEFLLRCFNRFVVPNIHAQEQKYWPHSVIMKPKYSITKSDVKRIVKYYELYLKDNYAVVSTFSTQRLKSTISKLKNANTNLSNATKFTKNKSLKIFNTLSKEKEELTKCKKDFKDISGDIDKFFIEMEDYIKTQHPKYSPTFKLSNIFKLAYLDECNRIVQEL